MHVLYGNIKNFVKSENIDAFRDQLISRDHKLFLEYKKINPPDRSV